MVANVDKCYLLTSTLEEVGVKIENHTHVKKMGHTSEILFGTY